MIWFAGDVHGHFEHIARAIDAASVKPAAIILLGDMEAPAPLHECMLEVESRGVLWHWIAGNHDTDCQENFSNISDPISMTHSIDGRVVAIDGVRVAGLGGVFRGEIWYPPADPAFRSYAIYEKSVRTQRQIKQRLSKQDNVQSHAVPLETRQWASQALDHSRTGKLLKHRSTLFPELFEQLSRQRADILVCHEAPSCHPHGFSEIDELARAMEVQAIFHGHHHESREYSAQSDLLGFRAYGVGFCGIYDQNGNAIYKVR